VDLSRTPPKINILWILHLPRTPRKIILFPPRINPAGFLTQFSLPDSLNATKGQKQNHQSVACLFACQFTISNQSSLFFYPFAAPPLAIAVAVAVLIALALLIALAACCACACTS
jgi:hypothetical protein